LHIFAEKKKIRAGNHRDSILTAHQLNSLNQAGIEGPIACFSIALFEIRHSANLAPTLKSSIEYIGLPTKYPK
jgi:hypothetical protein